MKRLNVLKKVGLFFLDVEGKVVARVKGGEIDYAEKEYNLSKDDIYSRFNFYIERFNDHL